MAHLKISDLPSASSVLALDSASLMTMTELTEEETAYIKGGERGYWEGLWHWLWDVPQPSNASILVRG
jgi:hypothetical protein